MNEGDRNFCKQDGEDLEKLFNAQMTNIKSLIETNDKNYNQKFDSILQAIKIGLESADKAVNKAESANEKRFESVNEFRQTLSDQASKFIIRTEFELVVSRLEQDIRNLVLTRSEMLPVKVYDASYKDLQKQVDDLRLSRALLEGKASQESVLQASGRAQIGIAFGLIATVIAIINFLSRVT